MEIINKRIRNRIVALGTTAGRVAIEMGICLSAVEHWANGRACPKAVDITRLCEVLECDPNYLFGWKD